MTTGTGRCANHWSALRHPGLMGNGLAEPWNPPVCFPPLHPEIQHRVTANLYPRVIAIRLPNRFATLRPTKNRQIPIVS